MNCAVVIPVGPGHQEIVHEAIDSVQQAVAYSKGPFKEVRLAVGDDSQGEHGRSKTRNRSARAAFDAGANWLFFLDADDFLDIRAFEKAHAPIVHGFEAIWGSIWTTAGERKGQVWPETFEDYIWAEPFLTLQIGHFVMSEVAICNPFDEGMNCGEDVDYYLRVWRRHHCTKIRERLMVNRRGLHSVGPKAGTGAQWSETTSAMIWQARQENQGLCVGAGLRA